MEALMSFPGGIMSGLKSFLFVFVFLAILWLMLVGTTQSDEMIIGGVSSLLLALVFFRNKVHSEMKMNLKAVIFIPVYFIVFVLALVKSNLDVAYRVVHPRLPIKPGIVKVKTTLKSRVGRLTLANSITLTPGTLTVDVKDDILYIHWINVSGKDINDSTEQIVKGFEKYLEVIFG